VSFHLRTSFLALALVFGLGLAAEAGPGEKKKGARDARTTASERHIDSLEPRFAKKVRAVLKALEKKGWQPVVISGRRSLAQQKKIVSGGRSRTMKSLHLCGRAADIMDRRYGWKGRAAKPSFEFWVDLGKAARAEGLEWGGDWKRVKDVPHIQIGPKCGVAPPKKDR
jgi:peptidoglycan L-alanyl-D-glutamate endopeptidase CwlK